MNASHYVDGEARKKQFTSGLYEPPVLRGCGSSLLRTAACESRARASRDEFVFSGIPLIKK